MLANWSYTPYDTPVFGIIVVSGLAWISAFVYGVRSPQNRIKAIVLQFAINTEIGILSALSYVWGMGNTAESSFAIGRYPDNSTMLPYEKIAVFDPSQFLGDVRFYYRVSEVGMWLYGVTFLLTIFGVMLFWPKQTKKPNKAQMATPRKPSD